MHIRHRNVGKTAGHEDQPSTGVDAYTLDNGHNLAITVWSYGASLVEVLVPDNNGTQENVVLRLPDLASYEDRSRNAYYGSTMGRFARCIAHGRFSLDGVGYQLDCNMGKHHFHGGHAGFDRFVWKATPEQHKDYLALRLGLHSPDGHQGYPGAVNVETTYRVHNSGVLSIEYRATTSKSTILDLTNHAFWNLAGSGTINHQILTLNTAKIVLTDEELIPLGQTGDVSGAELDFTTGRRIGSTKIDHCFVPDKDRFAARLYDPLSDRLMEIRTDQPGLAVYSADGLHTPRAGLCLQTGAWPDAPNHPEFPSARLDPGAVYRHKTTYTFTSSAP